MEEETGTSADKTEDVKSEAKQVRTPFLKRFWWIFPIIFLIFSGVGIAALLGTQHDRGRDIKTLSKKVGEFGWPDPTAKYITAVPVDLSQIQSISKYRSCAGHNRDGYDFDRVLELDRSMKHYFYPIPRFQGTMDKVKLFAPFDGTIIQISWEKDKNIPQRPHHGNGIDFGTDKDPNVKFNFGHIYFARDFKVGDKVKAGELIGYAALESKINDFDIDLGARQFYGRDKDVKEVLGSAFDHMTDNVLAEFAKYGITPDNTKFTKEYRDANPCHFDNPDLYISAKYKTENDPTGRLGPDWVQLRH